LRKTPIAWALMCALPCAPPVFAQGALALRMQTTIVGVPDGKSGVPAPVYMEGDRMQGHTERETEAQGNARARSRGQSIAADWMRFDSRINELTAIGNVHLEQGAYVADGVRLRYDFDTERGVMERATYFINPRNSGNLPTVPSTPAAPLAAGPAGATATRQAMSGRGVAERIIFDGPGQFRAQQASFTTCEPGNDQWNIHSQDLRIYQDQGVGVARNATVDFKGKPFFYAPYFSFPLHQERKTGFLAPHYGSTSASGFEVTTPFFWNMAPNYDLTITPRVLSKRGLQIRNDFRYLMPDYRGEAHFEILPDDRAAERTRQLFQLKHSHTLPAGWAGTLDINKVSDAKYFTDLSTAVGLTSQTYLTRQGALSRGGVWGNGGTYAFSTLIQGWQTLQTDPLAPLTPPYSRRPQLTLTAQRFNTLRGDFNFEGSYTDFYHPTLDNGKRIVAYPSMTFPLQAAAWFVTPKIGLHASRYVMDQRTSVLPDATRTLPIFSVNTGLNFERKANIFGNSFLQTLEPVAYYVNIPYRNQSNLPNFESGLQDINFASIFSENQFSGHDRINDANQLTLGLRSRLINPDSGFEVIRAGIAQRYYFEGQRVTLPGVAPRSNSSVRSDMLAVVSGTIAPKLSMDLGWQYNTDTHQTQRTTAAARYQPEQGKLLNLAYRQSIASSIRQWDMSAQWPIARGWSAVGRWNYSVQDKRTLEAVGGMEYDGGCFVFRVVAHRLSTATTVANTAFFVELELNGITRVGSNSLDLLRRNISGYMRHDPYAARPGEYYVPER
jgi:LPS-assembly protein